MTTVYLCERVFISGDFRAVEANFTPVEGESGTPVTILATDWTALGGTPVKGKRYRLTQLEEMETEPLWDMS